MDDTKVETITELPCGCVVTCVVINGVNAFVMNPCSDNCEYLRYVVEETRRQGKELKFKLKDVQ